jgi:hypothetical protein
LNALCVLELSTEKPVQMFYGKGFTTATNMYRHIRTSCDVKKENDDEKNKSKIINALKQENKQLKKKCLI